MSPDAGAAPNPISMFLPFIGMFAIFYFLVFRPQSQQRKQHEQMLKNIKKHDEVVTTGGVFGTVVNVRSDSFTLRVDENVRIEVEKTAIARLVKGRGEVEAVPAGEKSA